MQQGFVRVTNHLALTPLLLDIGIFTPGKEEIRHESFLVLPSSDCLGATGKRTRSRKPTTTTNNAMMMMMMTLEAHTPLSCSAFGTTCALTRAQCPD